MDKNNKNNFEEPRPPVDDRLTSNSRRDVVRSDAVRVNVLPPSSTAFLIPPDEDDDRGSHTSLHSSRKENVKLSYLTDSSREGNTGALSVSSVVVSPLSSNEGKQTVKSSNSSSDVPPILPFPEKAEESSRESFQILSEASLRIGCAVLNKESRSVHKRIREFNELEERLKFLEALDEAKGPEGRQNRSIDSNENEAIPLRKRLKVAKDYDESSQDERSQDERSQEEKQSVIERVADEVRSNDASFSVEVKRQISSLNSSSLTLDRLKERVGREGVMLHDHATRMRNLSELLRLYQETGLLIARELDKITR